MKKAVVWIVVLAILGTGGYFAYRYFTTLHVTVAEATDPTIQSEAGDRLAAMMVEWVEAVEAANYGGALEVAQRLKRLDPKNAMPCYLEAGCLCQLGRHGDALDAMEAGNARGSFYLYWRGEVFRRHTPMTESESLMRPFLWVADTFRDQATQMKSGDAARASDLVYQMGMCVAKGHPRSTDVFVMGAVIPYRSYEVRKAVAEASGDSATVTKMVGQHEEYKAALKKILLAHIMPVLDEMGRQRETTARDLTTYGYPRTLDEPAVEKAIAQLGTLPRPSG